MGDAAIEADPAEHTGEAAVDEKSVDPGGFSGEDDAERPGGIAWNSGGECEPVAGPPGDDADPGVPSFQCRGNRAHGTVTATDDDIGHAFFFDQWDQKGIVAGGVGGENTEFDPGVFCAPGDQVL